MIEIVSRPIKSSCNFNALNPIVYNLLRRDHEFDQINDNGGFVQLQFNAEDLTTFFEVDDVVYVEGLGSGTVTASAFSTNTLVTLDIAFTATATGYVNNLSKRTDHKIEVEVFDYLTDESLGPRIVVDTAEDGTAKANIVALVWAYIQAEWEEVALNQAEEHTSKKVYIVTQEFYDQTYFTEESDELNPVIAVFGYIPLLLNTPPNFTRYAHGGNLLSYFPESSERKFLQRFTRPSMWKDYPWSISFIWPETIATIDRRLKQYDSEGTELADALEPLEAGSGPGTDMVHRLALGLLHVDAVEVKLSLETEGTQITEEITIDLKDACELPVLLFWKNCLGGDMFWMFDESQEYEHTYPNGRKVKRLSLFADNLTVEQWEAINELNSGSEVIAKNIVDYELSNVVDRTHFRNDNQVFIINQDAEKVGVIAVATGADTRTHFKKHSLQITIELPEFFTV